MTRRQHPTRAGDATRTVLVPRAQVEFLVEGDLARLGAIVGPDAVGGTPDTFAIATADLDALVAEWADAFGGDRRPGADCAIPAWTPALAALAASRQGTAAALTRHALALTDYLAFGRAIPLRQLAAELAAAGDPSHGDGHRSVRAPDAEVTRLAADLQHARVAHEAAQTAYRDAVWQAVATAASLPSPSADRPTRDGEPGRYSD